MFTQRSACIAQNVEAQCRRVHGAEKLEKLFIICRCHTIGKRCQQVQQHIDGSLFHDNEHAVRGEDEEMPGCFGKLRG